MRPSVLRGLRRTCRVCGVEKFASVFPPKRATCRQCYSAEQMARQRVLRGQRERMGLTKCGGRPRKQMPVSWFERTITALESEWGVPYRQWTRAQHEIHSAQLRAAAGVPEDEQPAPARWQERAA